ncbi:DUF4393 domain-containing protein [Bacillus sp. JCM 19034]|uniref:DUF4393 domain-containing protein n=1 Tax=Bacillus sp. JCM 19034 TaxID=1481928 RepID=UPI0007821519|nr:DUF4393 domain-containing protein [Bacillus sp. JCM 19034]
MDINIVPKFIDNALSPPAKAAGDTLTNLWELGVGNHLRLWVKKQETRHQKNLELYKQKIEEKTQAIPPENITEPNISIVGPAIEASKYYIDSEELRNMFANLIASSIDKTKIDGTHPSFVEIIKQLDSLDAQNIERFKNKKSYALCEIRANFNDGEGYNPILTNIFEPTMDHKNYYAISSSLNNLNRLGLLNISYSIYRPDFNYDKFKETQIFKTIEKQADISQEYKDCVIGKGAVSKTPLGENFIKICLS